MCVIAIAEKARPTQMMIEDMFAANNHGAGIASRIGQGENKEVEWIKGLDLDAIKEYVRETPLPFIVHFRIASCGGITPKLTHPFPIEKDTNLELEGRTKGNVLFHNGHWTRWMEEKYNLDVSLKTGVPIPKGKNWSDTRLMAWLCSIYGVGFMDWVGEKGVAFGPNYLEVFFGRDGWTKIDDIWFSNTGFQSKKTRQEEKRDKGEHKSSGIIINRTLVCRGQQCVRLDIDDTGFCFECREKRRKDAFHTPNAADGNVMVREQKENPKQLEAPAKREVPFPPVDVVEALFKERNCSRQFLKKTRKHWQKEAFKAAKLQAQEALMAGLKKNTGPVLPLD